MSDTLASRTSGTGSVSHGPAAGGPARAKVKHRPSWIAFVVLGSIVCLGMGVWQLARYQEASGTVQNLGYTFMWPFLAGFLVYAYSKYIRLEAEETDAELRHPESGEIEGDDDEVGGARKETRSRRTARQRGPNATEIPADLLPTRRPVADSQTSDEGLEAYNSYLAALAREDGAGADHHQERSAT